MVKPRRLSDRHLAIYMVGTQAALAITIPLVTLFLVSKTVALAALSGGWIATIANGYFAIQAFRFSGASASSQMIRAMYRGEAGKFVIVAVLFVAAFRYMESAREHALALIMTFMAVHCSAWFVPALAAKFGSQKGGRS
ncbi:MAG: ATP synthase subunit I [Ketobacteraceae bacterium]|nr:ATP synthase subunit I [Ketobacteraceae bacterium]